VRSVLPGEFSSLQSATFSVASRLWESLEGAVEKYRPLSLLGATQELSGTDVIVFHSTVENSDCATDLEQSRLTGKVWVCRLDPDLQSLYDR